MNYVLTLTLLFFLCLGFCGCPYYWNKDTMTLAWKPQSEPLSSDVEDSKNNFNLKRLEKGLYRQEVYEIMGMPDLYGQFRTSDDDNMAIFYYYTKTHIDDGSATISECTPLVMKNNKLAGWGKKELEAISNVP